MFESACVARKEMWSRVALGRYHAGNSRARLGLDSRVERAVRGVERKRRFASSRVPCQFLPRGVLAQYHCGPEACIRHPQVSALSAKRGKASLPEWAPNSPGKGLQQPDRTRTLVSASQISSDAVSTHRGCPHTRALATFSCRLATAQVANVRPDPPRPFPDARNVVHSTCTCCS